MGESNTTSFSRLSLGDAVGLHTLALTATLEDAVELHTLALTATLEDTVGLHMLTLLQISEVYQS